MRYERTQTGVCSGCGKVKGVKADGLIAVHKVEKEGKNVRCDGYNKPPQDSAGQSV